jgi:hypothetical protein
MDAPSNKLALKNIERHGRHTCDMTSGNEFNLNLKSDLIPDPTEIRRTRGCNSMEKNQKSNGMAGDGPLGISNNCESSRLTLL